MMHATNTKAQKEQATDLQPREGAFDLSRSHVARNSVGRVAENEK
jgi:hypothetical protein